MLSSLKRAGLGGALRMKLEYWFGASSTIDNENKTLAGIGDPDDFKLLGRGKDGASYQQCSTPHRVVKILSGFGLSFFDQTRQVKDLLAKLPWFYELEIHDNWYSYAWQDLKPGSSYESDFLTTLKQLCQMEAALCSESFLYWDLGSAHTNYLFTADKELKIIDYGGNAFIPVQGTRVPPHKSTWRKNISVANNDFLRAQILLHICEFGLGEVFVRELRIASQFSDQGNQRATQWCTRRVKGTAYESFCKQLMQANLLKPESWTELAELAATAATAAAGATQEVADIDSVRLLPGRAEIRGYQSYDINSDGFSFLEKGNLWDTKQKAEIVDSILTRLNKESKLQSLMDIGSNLGAYVFLAAISHKVPLCYGVDYNKDYTDRCNEIALHLGINCAKFVHGKFSEIGDKVELTLALGLVHHLYQRTESYGSLKSIVDQLSATTSRFLLVEFPDENDNKASKWTSMPGRSAESPYSRQVFEEALAAEFKSHELVGHISETRHFYLCSK